MLHTIADERAPLSRITAANTVDVRFPTSEQLDGSDAMNPDPDYSAAYLSLATDAGDGLVGAGFVFTTGRGNNIAAEAIQTVADDARRRVGRGPAGRHGRHLPALRLRPAPALARTGEGRHAHGHRRRGQRAVGSQGQAGRAAAVAARLGDVTRGAGRPRRLPLPHRRDHPRRGARDLREGGPRPGGAHRAAAPATAIPPTRPHPAGSGYSDEKMVRLAREAVAEGFTQIKLKVGGNLDDDIRRLSLARDEVGPDIKIAIDANQRWDVDEAIAWVSSCSRSTSPGSRSRPAPTTWSATPPSARDSPASRWPPASTPPTG